jgi:ribosomal protein S12
MCQIGDLIRIESYIGDDGAMVARHTFVVLSTEGDKIRGLSFDLVASPMSSIKNEEQRKKIEKDDGLMIISPALIIKCLVL